MADRVRVIGCEGVSLTYDVQGGDGVHALEHVDLQIESGRLCVIAGASGSGKTSLARIICALERPTSGRVHLDGQSFGDAPTRHRRALRRERFGFVAASTAVTRAAGTTVGQQLSLAARLRDAQTGWRDTAVQRLRALDLDGRLSVRIETLSTGEQVRANLAVALVGEPTLLVVDEPTAALDGARAQLVLDVLHESSGSGMAVVVTTHDPQVIASADDLITMRSGRIVDP